MRRLAVLVSMLASIAACDPSSAVHTSRCTTSSDCTAPMMCIDNSCRLPGDAGPGGNMDGGGPRDAHVRNVTGIHVEPAGVTMLTAVDGAMPTQAFTVLADYDDGSSMAVTTGVWSADAPVIGAIDRTTGLYTAGGIVGGTSTITVSASEQTATAMVHVAIARNIIDTGAPADAATHFTGVTPVDDAARATALLYPLDHAVFPQNVYPANVQWSGGVAGDLYQVRLDAPGVTVRAYVVHSGGSFGFHWLPTPEAWRALAESATEVDVTVSVDRWEASTNTVITGHGVTVRFANATIRGAIYYWDLGQGRIQRINGDGTGLISFMPNPPRQPTNSANQCVACHAISRDGRRMAGELWDASDTSAIFDLTADTTADPPAMVVPSGVVSFLTASFSPDNSRLIASSANRLFLVDGNSGATIPTSLPTTSTSQPEWSPDGTQIAFVQTDNGAAGWAIDFTHGDLGIIDVMAGDTFGTPHVILSAGTPAVIARPSWSPDSGLIAFQHGVHSRSFLDPGAPANRQPARVEMVSRDGATSYSLDNLNGGATDSYYPTFSPFDEGGYFWLAFFSTRDYGNAQVGTAGTSRRQLWVAAIDSTPTGGIDPSFAPYWLPQQNVADQNMAAFWTQEACHMDGLHCSTSGECCSGFCRDTGSGPMCVPPDTVSCSHEGEACASDSDCCADEGNSCLGNRCGHIV